MRILQSAVTKGKKTLQSIHDAHPRAITLKPISVLGLVNRVKERISVPALRLEPHSCCLGGNR